MSWCWEGRSPLRSEGTEKGVLETDSRTLCAHISQNLHLNRDLRQSLTSPPTRRWAWEQLTTGKAGTWQTCRLSGPTQQPSGVGYPLTSRDTALTCQVGGHSPTFNLLPSHAPPNTLFQNSPSAPTANKRLPRCPDDSCSGESAKLSANTMGCLSF